MKKGAHRAPFFIEGQPQLGLQIIRPQPERS